MSLQFCQGSSRFVTRAEGRTTFHGYSFGAHYDPERIGFGALIAHNDERLPPGTGYPDHPHVDTEIVTFVLTGALRHTDSTGRTGVLEAGDVQRLSAGSGVVHSEVSESGEETRFIQAWVRPDESGLVPSYDEAAGVSPAGLTRLVGPGALSINASAELHVAWLAAGESVSLPDAPRLHVFIGAGAVLLGDRTLHDGDSVHVVDEGGRELVGGRGGGVALVWAFGPVNPL